MPTRAIWFCVSFLLVAPAAWAKPQHRQNLKKYYAGFLGNSLNACTTCHIKKEEADDPEDFEVKPPHNVFGARLKELGRELRAQGKPSDIVTRLQMVADEDADGDGVPNEIEILAGHAPGNPNDTPSADELARVVETRREFQRMRAGYQWDPFQTVTRPAVPTASSSAYPTSGGANRPADWPHNPIDAFIAAEHQERGLVPRPPATKPVLLRRVYLDLIGLPPTPDELHSFLDDESPDAYEKVVDRLLADPRYGERWGRHWMDIWRYSDWAGWTDGGQIRDSQPHIWRWRDWIVDSLNADKGYDRMILEMLAGDELAPTDPNTLRATGYLVRNYKMLSREMWLQDTVDHTAQAFLALRLGCARCHDHMYDPITQQEYYQVRAFFEPHNVRLDRIPGEPDTKKNGLARVFDAEPQAQTFLYIRGDDRNPDKEHPLAPAVLAALGTAEVKIEPVPLPLTAYVPEKLDYVVRETLVASEQAIGQANEKLEAATKTVAETEESLAGATKVAIDASAKLIDVQQKLGPARDSNKPELKEAQEAARQADEQLAKARRAAEAARDELLVAEMNVPLAAAKHAALVATMRVEQLEDSEARAKDLDTWTQAAIEATSTQRRSALLEARRDSVVARRGVERALATSEEIAKSVAQLPDDEKVKELSKKATADLTAAQTKLAESEKQLLKAKQEALLPPTVDYTKRNLKTYAATSSGRRLAFARWLANPQNPLTARVAANHIWVRHFGSGIVPTVFDFGQNGRPPSHPALLDWLAAELMQPSVPSTDSTAETSQAWSMKHLHRLIVTSATYRMASTPDPANLALDPDNRFLWRMNSRRMEAELVRDCLLYVAGQLDATMGGAELDHQLGLSTRRRSIYYRHAAEKQMEFLKLFDVAGVTECYERKESVMPQQALALANSELSLAQARLLARSLASKSGSDATAFVTAAFEQVLSRSPSPREVEECLNFLATQTKFLHDNQAKLVATTSESSDASKPGATPELHARENLVHVLLNHNDFVTIR